MVHLARGNSARGGWRGVGWCVIPAMADSESTVAGNGPGNTPGGVPLSSEGQAVATGSGAGNDAAGLKSLMSDVKKIEKKTVKLTPAEQIHRLVSRPGAKYFALNPFEVLNIPWRSTPDEVKKAYKKVWHLRSGK